MNRIILSLICLLILLTTACVRSKTEKGLKWRPIDAEFDSIAEIMDFKRLGMDNDISLQMDSMRAVFTRSPNKDALRGRMAYWEAFNQYWKKHDVDSSLIWLSRAQSFTDSAKLPYDWARIKYSMDIDPARDLYTRYCSIMECHRIFEKSGDSIYVFLCDTDLGNIMARIGNYSLAHHYMKKALDGFRRCQMDYIVPRIKMNMAMLLFDHGCINEADSVINEVLADSSMYVNPSLQNLVYMNKYIISGDTAYLRKAYEIVRTRPYDLERHILESADLGNMFLLDNRLDSADRYLSFAYHNIDGVPVLEYKKDIAIARLHYLLRKKKDYELLDVFDTVMLILDSLGRESCNENIINAEIRQKIEFMKLSEIRTQQRSSNVLLAVILLSITLLLAAGGGVLLYKNRILREKYEADLRLRKNRESMAAMKLRQGTVREFLEKFELELDHTANSPQNISDIINLIKRRIKLYKAQVAQWDTVLESFDEIYPDFEARMLKAYPLLTKKQIEFAGYIAIGLTSKQIAELLNIDTSSVNTNRYRLRTKMGLSKNQSLEDAVSDIIG